MQRVKTTALAVWALLGLLGTSGPLRTLAGPDRAPVAPAEGGVYTEDFTAYAAKDYTENAEWDIWARVLRLGPMDSTGQRLPAIARGGDGNIVVIWQDYRRGNDDIYAQKLDGSGNRLWMADVRVNSDSGLAHQSAPTVAMDGNGNAIVVWKDERNDNGDIYAQKLDRSGNKVWMADVRVDSDGSMADQGYPGVAVDRSGNAVVVWRDERNDNGDIYAQKLDGSGNRLWAADVCVNSDSGTASQGYPGVAVDASGNAVVVWMDYRHGNYDIYAQKLEVSGNKLWVADVRANSDGGTAYQRYPAMSVDGSGNTFVVWMDSRHGNYDIYAQKLDASGNRLWEVDMRVNSDSGTSHQESPGVAMDGSGHAVVAWWDERNGNYDVYAQKLDASGNKLWAADVRVNSDRGVGRGPPAMAMDGGRNAIVVWMDERNGFRDIYAQGLDGSGNRLWVADVRVNSDSGTREQDYPAMAMDGSGNAVIVWRDSRNDSLDIYAQKLDASGNKLWTANVRMNSDAGRTYQGYPAIAMDGSENAVVVWEDKRNDFGDIYAQKLDRSGNKLWMADVRVNSDSGTAYQGYPAIAMDGSGNAVVVWEDKRNDFGDIYAQKLDGSGNRLWAADVRVNSDSGTREQDYPAMAMDGSGNTAVVWRDYRNGSADFYVQKLDGSGNKLWMADVRVNSDSGTVYQYSPAVAVDGSGNAVVVWADYRNGPWDIYAQKLERSGNRLWAADVRVNSDSGTAHRYSPAVAVDGSGNAIVVWADYRNDHGDVYAQKLDGSGNKLWVADLRVNTDSGTVDQHSPAVAVDWSGNTFVVWCDERNGNDDVYAQKINSVGGKAWLADLQVVYPDRFYFPTGTAQSRTVDDVEGDIAQATLIADYQTKGGDIQFYLTNDGGTRWAEVTPGATHVFTTTGSDLRWRAVLSVDPVWNRTPVINSLRIEYSTQVPYADDYEEDDTCAHARPIQVNGAAQAHTFHQAGDADWAWFDVISGTTYIVETYNFGTRAQTVVEPHRTCQAPPAGTGRSFGNGYTFSFTADQTGRFYVKVYNHTPSIYGQDTDYTLSVRSVRPSAVAIVVAGHDDLDSYQDNILCAADRAYRVFLNAGLGKANVRYLAPLVDHDADGNGANDVAGLSTPANVRDAIQDWARERGVALEVPLYVYLVDHGLVDRFKADGDPLASHVTAADLNLWLSNLEATTGADNVNVILDACHSGSFIDVTAAGPASISGRNRVVIASTTSDWQAYGPPGGDGLYFSNAFFSGLENEQSLWASYAGARQAVENQGLLQQPWLDDNGDQRSDSQDGALASGRALQRVAMGGQSPHIEWLSASEGVIRAKVVDDSAWVGVKVEVFAPSYVPPEPDGSGTTRIVDVPVVALADLDSDRVYEGSYTFADRGVYRLVAHAEDAEGNLALPQGVQVCVGCVYLPLVLR